MPFACRRLRAAIPALRRWCFSLVPDMGKSWRTRRMARRKRNVSDLPYAAPPLSCAAFFVKVQKTEIRKAERGGTLRVFNYLS